MKCEEKKWDKIVVAITLDKKMKEYLEIAKIQDWTISLSFILNDYLKLLCENNISSHN